MGIGEERKAHNLESKPRPFLASLFLCLSLLMAGIALARTIVPSALNTQLSSSPVIATQQQKTDNLSLQVTSLGEVIKEVRGQKGGTGEAGPQGPKGEQGAKGDQGPPGKDATLNGDASNLTVGTLADGRLSINVTIQGNTFNGVDQLVKLDSSGNLPVLNASSLTNLNAGNLSSGTLNDLRLSSNVTLQGNSFNGNSQLVKLDGSGNLPALNAAALTSIAAGNISSGSVNDLRLSSNVTLQGNSFNGVSQLVKLDSSGNLPALNSSALTNLNGSSIASGSVADARLTSNVSLLNGNQTASGNKTFTGTALFQNSSNSTTAFQVQNANGASVLLVDTTPLNNFLSNSSFENNSITGWAHLGSGGSISRTTTYSYTGQASLRVVNTAATNRGVYYTTGNGVSALSPSSSYVISWYDLLDSASLALTDIRAVYARDGVTETVCTGINTQVVTANGWTRHFCTITTDATAPASSAYVGIEQTAATAHTFYIDAVQIEQFFGNSVGTAYKETGLSLNGLINSPVSIRPSLDSTTVFQVQSAGGGFTILSIDSLNVRINLFASLYSAVPDSSTSIAFDFNTSASYATAGAKLLSVKNNSSEKFAIDKDGNIQVTSGAALAYQGSGNTTNIVSKKFICSAIVNAGDIVIIDTATAGQLTTTSTANSALVAGVVKTGTALPNQTCEVALNGIIQVNVTSAAVAIGDRLTTSTSAGLGATNNAPSVATVIGKALSAKSAGGPGQVWALVSLQ